MLIAGVSALVIFIVFLVVTGVGAKSKLDVDPDRITISEVTKGPFQDIIPVNGVVAPITTIYPTLLKAAGSRKNLLRMVPK